MDSAETKFKSLAAGLGADWVGITTRILERSNKGIQVQIILPHENQGLIKEEKEYEFDIESLDFYKDRRFLIAILDREEYRCFYTGKKIITDTCYLDHVTPLSAGGDNSYKNIVACCYDVNSMKSDNAVEWIILLPVLKSSKKILRSN